MLTRREGIQAAALTALSYSRVLGANDRVQFGLIGCGERGLYVASIFQKTTQVDVRAVCDVFGDHTDKAVAQAAGAQTFTDHRRLLEMKDLEAVLIATPDHWHKAIAIDALNAGKDVYVEKPLTRLREEGPEIVRAARVNNRVCQVGMQQRSGEVYLEARERFVRSGLLGKISHVDCVWHGGANRALPTESAEKSANLDWVRFLGALKYRDWNPAQYLDFRAFLDFGGGKLTDFGAQTLAQFMPASYLVSGFQGIFFRHQGLRPMGQHRRGHGGTREEQHRHVDALNGDGGFGHGVGDGGENQADGAHREDAERGHEKQREPILRHGHGVDEMGQPHQQDEHGKEEQPAADHGRHQDGERRDGSHLEAAQNIGLALLHAAHSGTP